MGLALKPFLPQLQTTFLKALQDSSRAVRLRAAEALGQLVSIHSKVDPLFTEQLAAIRNAEDSGVRWVEFKGHLQGPVHSEERALWKWAETQMVLHKDGLPLAMMENPGLMGHPCSGARWC